jgi:hypothetical protein
MRYGHHFGRIMPNRTMMTSTHERFSRAAACLVFAATGCVAGAGPEAKVGEVSAEVVAANGISVNGISVNGISVNGTTTNGISVNGISVNGISVNGISVNGVAVSATQIKGVDVFGDVVTGDDWVGAKLVAQLTNGSLLPLRIDGTQMLPEPNADVRTFTISYASGTGWKPLCTTTTNEALAFPGTWNLATVRHQADSTMFSLGCRGATFAKCVELGYKGDNLIDSYHAACIRAIRADYCGDGQSHTITGTQINIYDKLGKQLDTQNWSLESTWTPDGATCLYKARVLDSLVEPDVPECVADLAETECAENGWGKGVLIRTEVNK